jgi:hypothetical protein
MTLKIGDRIGEYKLAKILPDLIALEAMEDTFEVLLYDPSKLKKRIYTRTESKPAAITTSIPASSATSASPQIIPSQESPKTAGSIRDRTTKTPLPRPAPPLLLLPPEAEGQPHMRQEHPHPQGSQVHPQAPKLPKKELVQIFFSCLQTLRLPLLRQLLPKPL